MDSEVLGSICPENVGNEVEKPGGDQMQDITFVEELTVVGFKHHVELSNYSQLENLAKSWEYKQENVVRLLREELDILGQQRQEIELKKLQILEEHRFKEEAGKKCPISLLQDAVAQTKAVEIDAENETAVCWKQRAIHLEELLDASIERDQVRMEKPQERQSSPAEEFSQILKCESYKNKFLHFILQNAPVIIDHQDILGKTDVEIFTGPGVKEFHEFKLYVIERSIPEKREITLESLLFGSKTFLMYVEPVFTKAGETAGVNYIGMDVIDQVRKREKMAKLRDKIAVQKAKETELNKQSPQQDTMQAKDRKLLSASHSSYQYGLHDHGEGSHQIH